MKVAIYAGCSENPAENILEVETTKITGNVGMLRLWVEGDGPPHPYKRVTTGLDEEVVTVYDVPMDEIVNIMVADVAPQVAPTKNVEVPRDLKMGNIKERLSHLLQSRAISKSLSETLEGIADEQHQTDWYTFLRANTRSSLLQYQGISNRNISTVELVYKKNGLVLV